MTLYTNDERFLLHRDVTPKLSHGRMWWFAFCHASNYCTSIESGSASASESAVSTFRADKSVGDQRQEEFPRSTST